MSHSFKCGQFDDAYRPKRLQNWQTPRWDPEKPPRDPFKFRKTEVIVNEKGHLLPGVNRPDRNPWNNYVGTYDMPAVVTKAIATDIATRPAYCIEYLDKPNPVKPAVNEPSATLKNRPGNSKVTEGPDDPDHSHFFLSGEDYADHEKRIKEASELAKEYLKCRKLVPKEEAERACRARQLERELWTSRECQRRAEVHQDIQWLKNQRLFPNIVSRQMNWSAKSQPPRTGLGADGPLFGLGGEDTVARFVSGKQKDTAFFEKKRKSSVKISEEEARRIYELCMPDLRSGRNQLHRVLSEGDEICEPYDGSNVTGDQSNRALRQTSIQEGGAGGLSNANVRESGGGGGPSIEFYCPVPREGAPRPVVTGELIDPNVRTYNWTRDTFDFRPPVQSDYGTPLYEILPDQRIGEMYGINPHPKKQDDGYVSKKFQKRLCGDRLPEHDCSKGCRTPLKEVPQGCSNERGCSPTFQQSTRNFDSGQNCQCGDCSPKCEANNSSQTLLKPTESYQDSTNLNGNPEYPQFEETDEVRRPQPYLPQVEPGRSDQADCYQNNLSCRYPQQEDNPNPYITGTGKPETPPSPKQACQVSGDTLQRNPTPAAVPRRQANLSAPSTALSLPPTKPPPPTPNVGAQFSLIGDPSQLCQPSAPPQRSPPAPPTALAAAPAASVIAKELKNANLEHQPLADAVLEAGFCRLASRGHPNPGIALDCVPAASGVGWRPFDAPGPTNCSKQRVYRPHTAGCGMHNTVTGAAFARAARPATSAPHRRHVSQMELAIGWDTIPDYPEDEPRPPKHVDGSNGSAAPGIFCRVPAPERTPALPTPPQMQTPMNHEPNSDEIKARLAMLQRDRAASAAIEACRRGAADQRRRNSAGGDPRNLEDHIGAGLKATNAASNAAHRRLPRRALPRRAAEQVLEASRVNRSCEACAAPNCDEPASAHRLPPAPFKAGKAPVCLSTNSSFNGGFSSGSGWDPTAAKSLNVPRPRHPFSSRGYEITTLAQPFAMDKNGSAGGAYPEHWRLASVYQLSYKPIVARNKPLMKAVFQ